MVPKAYSPRLLVCISATRTRKLDSGDNREGGVVWWIQVRARKDDVPSSYSAYGLHKKSGGDEPEHNDVTRRNNQGVSVVCYSK